MNRFVISLTLAIIANSTVHAAEKADLTLEAELDWLHAENINLIEVVSKQKEDKNKASGIVSLITRDEIERYGANNLHDLLGRVTSIYALGSYQYVDNTVSVRGDLFTHINNHTLLLINGRPFRESLFGGLNENLYRGFPIHNIEHIEIIRGSGSVLYGTNAYSGVINIVTKKNKDNALTVRGRYGSYETGQVESEFSYKNQDFASTGAIRYQNSNGWLVSAIGEDKNRSQFRSDADDISANIWATYKNFTFNGFLARNQHNHWSNRPADFGQVIENERLFFDLGYKQQITSYWTAQANITYNFFKNNFNVNTPYHGKSNNLLFEQTNFFSFFNNDLDILFGGLLEWQTGQGSWEGNKDIISNYSNLMSSLYLEGNYKIIKDLKLTLGGQWNHVDYLNQTVVQAGTNNPKFVEGKVGRIGLVYEFTPELGLKLLYSQAFRSPTPAELNINVPNSLFGNANLTSEQVETTDVQLFYHTKKIDTSVTVFRSRQANLINRTSVPNSLAKRYINKDSAVFLGVEYEGKFKLFNELQLTTAYTFQTNRDGNGKNNISVAPNHILKLGASYEVTKNFQISAFDSFFSKPKAIEGASIVNPISQSYHYLTVNMNYRFDNLFGSAAKHKPVILSLYLDNLLDEKIYYPEFNRKLINSVPGKAGRSVFGELAIEF